ncbi:MAG: hypothetical protein K6G22_05245 [Lachnospiraceae bacterium]|nr:hypothetical protein [Lachnospiraceae bacterium]
MSSAILIFIIIIGLFVRAYSKNPDIFKGAQNTPKRTGTVNRMNALGPAPAAKPFNSGMPPRAAVQASQNDFIRAHGGFSDSKVYKQMEDRKNDWMAKQLLEEKIAYYRVRKMFDFRYDAKKDHMENCDARDIRDSHRQNCDADMVDTGKGR